MTIFNRAFSFLLEQRKLFTKSRVDLSADRLGILTWPPFDYYFGTKIWLPRVRAGSLGSC